MSDSTESKLLRILAGLVLVATAGAVIVTAILMPVVAPWIAIGGVALAALIAAEVIKLAVLKWCGPCIPDCPRSCYNNPEPDAQDPVNQTHEVTTVSNSPNPHHSSVTFRWTHTEHLRHLDSDGDEHVIDNHDSGEGELDAEQITKAITTLNPG